MRIPAIATLLLLLGMPAPLRGVDQAPVDFERQIQPLLTDKCGGCHGVEKRSGGLSVLDAAELLRGGDSGPALTPRSPDQSPLFVRVRDGEMPPADSPALAAAQLELLRRWIAEGASTPRPGERPSVTTQRIVPLLWLRCVPCHGGRRQEAGLDLRTKESILKGGKSGPVVLPGHSADSPLIQRVVREEMPPRRQLVSVSVKPMDAAELRLLEAWIDSDLPDPPPAPGIADQQPAPDPLVTDEDRRFWSFQPPRRSAPPVQALTADDRRRANNEVDLFVLARLRERGLGLAPEADRETLIRRLHIDLTGLPPTPEEVDSFVADARPDAYEALVDRLLASPRYGERWGRHWLDVAGYADSEGGQNEDRIRPEMWRYRDYVIRAWNADKPFDRFLLEQVAGDELADYQRAETITPEMYDNLVATGFLRTAPDRTFANITNFVPDRLEVIADEIQILGSAVLGLTLHCGRCHSHKFDPFPQRDYYRLAAALKDALDEHDWLGPEARFLEQVTTAERRAWERHERSVDERAASLKERLAATPESQAEARQELERQLKAIDGERRPAPRIRALWSRGEPSPTFLLQRGNYLSPGEEVGPGVPAMLTDGSPLSVEPPWPGAPTTGRRLALARWLVGPDQPLTARVIVNRVWRHHFGVGLVTTLGNFGRAGTPPSHPELLDTLAVELVERGWSIKRLQRLLVTSAVYRQSSRVDDQRRQLDPDNRLLSRMPLRRLDAESLRDSLLAVSGALDERREGPADQVDIRGDGLVQVRRGVGGERRSVYVLHRRTSLPTILEAFDSPQMGPNCLDRGESLVAPQALHLLNNTAIRDLAERFAERARREAGDDVESQLVHLQRLAVGRRPSEAELRVAIDGLDQLRQAWLRAPGVAPDVAARRALDRYAHALLNSASFLFVD